MSRIGGWGEVLAVASIVSLATIMDIGGRMMLRLILMRMLLLVLLLIRMAVMITVVFMYGVSRMACNRPYHMCPGAHLRVVEWGLHVGHVAPVPTRRVRGMMRAAARLRLCQTLHDDRRMRGTPVRLEKFGQVFARLFQLVLI